MNQKKTNKIMEDLKTNNNEETTLTSTEKIKIAGLSVELLEDWLLALAAENSDTMKTAKGKLCHFKQENVVQMIFLICDKCKQPSEVKYTAIEIFDRFMVKHTEELYNYALSNNTERSRCLADWNLIMERVQNQITLRIISCIQIASKLSSHYRVITCNKARLLLKEAGHTYNFRSILNSELRILKTLDYKINIISPSTYIDIVLRILAHNYSAINTEPLEKIAYLILDLVYLKWQKIYETLFTNATGMVRMNSNDWVQFSPVENDYLFLSVTVICCAAFVTCAESAFMIAKQLETITAIPVDDISDFTSIITKLVSDQMYDD